MEIKQSKLPSIAIENEDGSITLFDGELFSRIEPEEVNDMKKR